jgi:glycerol kinase
VAPGCPRRPRRHDQSTSAGNICHAGLEAICFQVRTLLDSIARSTGCKVALLRVDGGPTRSPYLMQLQADILQLRSPSPPSTR